MDTKKNNKTEPSLAEVLGVGLKKTNPDKAPRVLFNTPSLQHITITDGQFSMISEQDGVLTVDYRIDDHEPYPGLVRYFAHVESGGGQSATVYCESVGNCAPVTRYVGRATRLGTTAESTFAKGDRA